ncbi:hypothetical protein, partial [Streptomyces caniscabiei]|uniref:hypothetical protein n=1 Tax=Streptomyces caniscabiei TaxID=2746961 RepID=UPI001C4EDD56
SGRPERDEVELLFAECLRLQVVVDPSRRSLAQFLNSAVCREITRIREQEFRDLTRRSCRL